MPKKRYKSLKSRIALRAARSPKTVFLPEDFKSLGGYYQVGRALGELVKEGRMARLGYGVYAELVATRRGNYMIANPAGVKGAYREALDRLGVDWEPSEAEQAYNAGESTQVPANASVVIKDRFARKLSYRGQELRTAKG